MNLTSMIQRCRNLLGEPDTANAFFLGTSGDTTITDELNDGLARVMGELRTNITYYDLPTVASTATYTLGTDFHMMKQVRVLDTEYYNIEPKDMREFLAYSGGNTTQEGRPRVYQLEIGAVDVTTALPADITFFPVPDKVYTVRMYYYQLPTILSSGTQITELHRFAQKAAIYYASANLALQMSDEAKHNILFAKYKEEMDQVKDWAFMHDADRPVEMRDEMGYTL